MQIVYSAQADKIDAGEFKSIFGDFLRENVVSPSYKRGTGMIVIECESTMSSCLAGNDEENNAVSILGKL